MKNSQRLDYSGLAAFLGQQNLVAAERLSLALQTSLAGSIPFPELLVTQNLIGDWELSRVVCDLYGLPFLPVGLCQPAAGASEGLDPEFLRQHRLVPMGRHGHLLTLCMPALVPAEVLGLLAATTELHILPVVGSVETNQRWLDEHLPAEQPPEQHPEMASSDAADWSNLFDEGDAAVLMDLNGELDPGGAGTE